MLSILFIGLLVLLAVVLPSQGYGPGTLNDPAKGIAFVASSPLPAVIDLIYLGNALVFVPITLALVERLRAAAHALMRVVLAAGLIASGLFLAYSMINFVGNPGAISAYQHDPATGAAVYLALRLTGNAMNASALFAAGWAIVLAGWAGLCTNQLPKALSVVMLLAGVSMIVSFALLPIGLIGVLLAPIWSAWLGLVLLRDHASERDSGKVLLAARG